MVQNHPNTEKNPNPTPPPYQKNLRRLYVHVQAAFINGWVDQQVRVGFPQVMNRLSTGVFVLPSTGCAHLVHRAALHARTYARFRAHTRPRYRHHNQTYCNVTYACVGLARHYDRLSVRTCASVVGVGGCVVCEVGVGVWCVGFVTSVTLLWFGLDMPFEAATSVLGVRQTRNGRMRNNEWD